MIKKRLKKVKLTKADSPLDYVIANDIYAQDLDALVHDVATREATRTNNQGVVSQLRYLQGKLGPGGLKKALKEIHEGNTTAV